MKASILLFLFIFIFANQSYLAQQQALDFITYPNSIPSFGMGGQSVALLNSKDAMTYNPANLVFSNGLDFSFFRQPFQMFGYIPMSNYSGTFKYKDYGVISFEYRIWDFGTVAVTTSHSPEPINHVENYYKNFVSGYAKQLSKDIALGAALKYSYFYVGERVSDLVSISLGMNYNFEIFSNRVNLGFSLMNLGPAVEFKYEAFDTGQELISAEPPPSNLNLGIYTEPIVNDFYSLGIQLAISKPFDRTENGEASSSFKTLFTDWSDFPNDATLSTGIGFIWKPLRLRDNIYFWQEFYLGNKSKGIKSLLANVYTHGGLVGIEYSGIKFSMGYAGYWHNVHYSNYWRWEFPWETVQFTFGLSGDYFLGNSNQKHNDTSLEKIVISGGAGYSNKVGKFSKPYEYLTFDNSTSYYIEAAFYFTKKMALISTFIYDPYNVNYHVENLISGQLNFETFSVLSSFRYHPIDVLNEFFIQTGIGIYRWNPVQQTSPRYDYKAIFVSAIGVELNIYNGIVVLPSVDWFLTFDRASGSAPRMQGWNQFDFVLKAGYSFN